MKPAQYASPHPEVSTTATWCAGSRIQSRSVISRLPSAPIVSTTPRAPKSSSRLAASSGRLAPVSLQACSALGMNQSTDGRMASSRASIFGEPSPRMSTLVVAPLARARRHGEVVAVRDGRDGRQTLR